MSVARARVFPIIAGDRIDRSSTLTRTTRVETSPDQQPVSVPASSDEALHQTVDDALIDNLPDDDATDNAAAAPEEASDPSPASGPGASQGVGPADVGALAGEVNPTSADDMAADKLLSPTDTGPQSGGRPADSESFQLPEYSIPANLNVDARRVTMLNDVNLRVKIELGRTQMLVEDVLRLGEGSVVELDKVAGDPVDVYVNDRLVARGEVLVLNDNFCVRISEVLSHDPHRVST